VDPKNVDKWVEKLARGLTIKRLVSDHSEWETRYNIQVNVFHYRSGQALRGPEVRVS